MSHSSVTCAPFSYTNLGVTPEGYVCKDCGAKGVRLYREYQTFLNHQHLRCRECAAKDQKPELDELVASGLRDLNEREHSIGWLVAAVPTEEGDTYWGFTSVPQAGVEWWESLPKTPSTITP